MSPLGVVHDFIASSHLNPLWNGTILLLFLSQDSLDSECLVRSHGEEKSQTGTLCERERQKLVVSNKNG